VSPDPTTSLYAYANNATEIGMSWLDNSPNESGWEIHRSTGGPTGTFTLRATLAANSTAYTDGSLSPLSNYCYKVRSYKKSGPNTSYAAFYNTSCATTYGPPQAASALDAIPRDYSNVDVVWTDNSTTETGFRLERGGAVAGPWEVVGTNPLPANATSAHDYGRPAEQLLCYRVVAVNQWGEAPSNVDCTAHVAAPTNVAAVSHDPQSIDVTWQDNSSFEDSFEILRGINGASYTVVANPAANVTSFHDTDVLPDIRYTYYLSAKRDGDGRVSNPASVVIISGPPIAPTVDAIPYGSTAVLVYFSPGSGSVSTEGGRIERNDNGVWNVVSGPLADPTLYDAGRVAEQRVCYRGIAYNSAGDSPPSAEDCTTPPAAPTNVTVSLGDASTVVTWIDNSSVEDAYELRFSYWYCDYWEGYCYEYPYTIWTEANATSYEFWNGDTFTGIAAVHDGGYSDDGTGPAFGNIAARASIRSMPKAASRPAAIHPTGRPAKLNGIRSAKKPGPRIR
jgi:hypothetical protein